jgi:hypothetical protein
VVGAKGKMHDQHDELGFDWLGRVDVRAAPVFSGVM